jgi:hypothetical protein
MGEIIDEAKKIARELKDECDGSYVGAEQKKNININGVDIELNVCAFWEKGFWFEYSAKGEGIDECDRIYLY